MSVEGRAKKEPKGAYFEFVTSFPRPILGCVVVEDGTPQEFDLRPRAGSGDSGGENSGEGLRPR